MQVPSEFGDTRSGAKVAPESCIALARTNVLAQQNGYGLALVFLDAAVPPEENTRRLDGYLLALSAASFGHIQRYDRIYWTVWIWRHAI